MKLLVVHLSDIHICTPRDEILSRANKIAAATFRELALVDGVVIVLTGDIAYSGLKEQYLLAEKWINEIRINIQNEKNLPVWVVPCPGNHDCDFESGQATIRSIVIDSLQTTAADSIGEEVIAACTSVQTEYSVFAERICNAELVHSHPLWKTYALKLNFKYIVFHSINVAWMSKRREDSGAIIFPLERFKSYIGAKSDCTLSLVHHPQNWFSQQSMKPFRRFVRQHSHIVLSGHEHTPGIVAVDEHGAGECVHLEAPALQEHKGFRSAFSTLILDTESDKFCYATHSWDGNSYSPEELEPGWAEFRKLPTKQANEFALSDSWLRYLQDPGASFKREQKALSLGDIYIYPELRPVGTDDRRTVVDASFLKGADSLLSGVMVRGSDNYGKTALLKHLFLAYYESGYVPVFLRGKELDKATELEVRKTVESAFVAQYSRRVLSKFWEVGVGKRILLIDDIDEFKFPDGKFDQVFDQLSKIFPRRLFTCDEVFEYRKLTLSDRYAALDGMSFYSMLEFGHRRRLELVQRWASLGDSQPRDESEVVALIDSAESKLTAIVGKNIVPSTPLFLLTILQGIEAGSAGDLQNSALGDYYLFLILGSLERQRVPRDQFGEIRNYCSHLSWFLQHQRDGRATDAELKAFHASFTDKHALNTAYEVRKKLLIDAELLEVREGAFKFRYPYIDYFFLGQYVHEHIEREDIQQFIRHACKTLHKKKSANIILFLSHHSRDVRVYESLVAVLSSQFSSEKPMQLDADVDVMNELVDSIPSLVYEDESVIEKRRRMRSREDAVDRESPEDDNAHDEDFADPQDPIVSMLTLMKTLEILGQFIKNHYGQLEADTKAILVSELFDASMRGLRGLISLFTDDSRSMVEHVEAMLKRRGVVDEPSRRNEKARKFIFGLLGMVAFSFVRKAAVSVATPNLSRVIDRVVDDHDSNAYRLIKTAVELDSAGGLNMVNIQRLNADLKGNPFSQSILQQIVMLHLHLFKTNDYQKQMIASELKIEMKQQRAVDFNSRRAKRVA